MHTDGFRARATEGPFTYTYPRQKKPARIKETVQADSLSWAGGFYLFIYLLCFSAFFPYNDHIILKCHLKILNKNVHTVNVTIFGPPFRETRVLIPAEWLS